MAFRDQNAIKECFTLFDKDADGQISRHELGTVVRSLGLNPTEAEVEEINRNMIKKESFGLSDLVQVMSRFSDDPRNKEEEIREAFRVFDRDNTGFISAAELKHVLTNIGEKLSDKEVDELIREIEVDKNGQVNYEDVVRLMCG